jgi:hypothetical protein
MTDTSENGTIVSSTADLCDDQQPGLQFIPSDITQVPSALVSETSLALIPKWPNIRVCDTDEFETAVECFFASPEITRVKERIDVLENSWLKEEIQHMEDSQTRNMPIIGYVYALWNPLFPDLLKIGATFRTSEIRARELSGTGLPEPFKVVAELRCRNPFKTERNIHTHYEQVRKYGKKKEFFTLTQREIMDHFQTLRSASMHTPSEQDDAAIKRRLKLMKSWMGKKIQKRKAAQEYQGQHRKRKDTQGEIDNMKKKLLWKRMDVSAQHTDDMTKAFELQEKLKNSCASVCENGELDADSKKVFKENFLKIASQSVVMGWNSAKKSKTTD